MVCRSFLVFVLTLALAANAVAAPPAADPDWPCQQRLVPHLSPATYWTGPAPPAGVDWHADPKLSALIEAISPRDVPTEDGIAKLTAFAQSLPAAERAKSVSLAFTALVEQTNEERDGVIARLKSLGARQRSLAKRIESDEAALQAIPADASGDQAAERAGITERHDLLVRSYHDIGETIRYACQVPSDLDARLGAYARALQALLSAP
ncbi:MAG: hypothetical protein LGL72_05140 [Acidibrevibacterium sp.]|jgi:hypothetical protein|uniref:hypothetical protein n=1 Tax=Acidibrevibacterium fodinaquatile TaxID=1969806 RepID=UPI0023A7B713|nr:hypothetical protein [Acidibrevibacterium fodinaquatile]MCA7118789.1 hypothetical protein [Acidibrevibacterium fodinaquatile]